MKTLAFHTPWAKARKQAGLSLVEVLASLTVASLVVGGALAMYTSASNSQRGNSLSEAVIGLSASTRSMFAAAGNYGNNVAVNAALRTAGKVPSNLTGAGAVINHPLGGVVNVTGANNNFTIGLTNIPQTTCIDLVTRSYPNAVSVSYGAVAGAALPVPPATAAIGCPAGITNVTFTFL